MENSLMNTYAPLSPIIEKGEGSFLFDTNNNKYIDFTSGIGVNCLGYNNSNINKAVTKQIKKLQHCSNIFLNPTNTNYYTSTGISKDDNLMYVMKNDFKLYTEVATTNLRIIPVISIDKNVLTKGEGTKDSPLEVNDEETR